MAIVSRKVSNELIPATAASGSRSSELNPMTARNPNANHGIVTFARPAPPFVRRASSRLMTSSTGASIITRIILTMTAPSAISAPMALPAPTTWATSCSVAPV